jgi:hypothetical protein
MKIYFLARIESYLDGKYEPLFSDGSEFKPEKQKALLEKIAFPTAWNLESDFLQDYQEFIDDCFEKNEDCGCYEESVKCKKPRGGKNRLFSPEKINKLVGNFKENYKNLYNSHFIFDLDGKIVKCLELNDGTLKNMEETEWFPKGEILTHKKELYQMLKQDNNIDFKTYEGLEEIDSIFIGNTRNDGINTIDYASPQLGIIFGEWIQEEQPEQEEQVGGSKKKTIRKKIKRSKKVSKGGRKTKSKKNKRRSKSRKTKRSKKN